MINLHQFSGCLDDVRLRQQHETAIFGNHRNDCGIYGSLLDLAPIFKHLRNHLMTHGKNETWEWLDI